MSGNGVIVVGEVRGIVQYVGRIDVSGNGVIVVIDVRGIEQ